MRERPDTDSVDPGFRDGPDGFEVHPTGCLQLDGHLPGVVRRAVFAGSHRVLTIVMDAGVELEIHTPHDDEHQPGGRVGIEIPPHAVTGIAAA